MQLIQRPLTSRVFLLQFLQIMEEFANEIPWLDPLRNLQWASNPQYFRDKLLSNFHCDDPSDIIPYQFISSDRAREYYGGIIYFRHSPENFLDRINVAILEKLTVADYHYVSCLQVRDPHKHVVRSSEITRRAIRLMQKEHKSFWGVVSDRRLMNWYVRLGARVLNSKPNKDNLYLIAWD